MSPVSGATIIAGRIGPAVAAAPARCHGLDWLRAVAALLVVLLHAGIAYSLAPWPGLAWPVHDAQPSNIVDALTWAIDSCIMPLFFLQSGYMAAQLLTDRGSAAFLRHRVRRVLWPLLFGLVAILPVDLYVWLLGWVVEERIPLKKLRSLKLGPVGENLWGIGHLWFLQYLFVFCLLAWTIHYSFDGWRAVRASKGLLRLKRGKLIKQFDRAVSSVWGPLLGAIPAMLILCWQPQIVIGFRHSWLPLTANMLYYAPCFIIGWFLRKRSHRHKSTPAQAAAQLGIAGVLLAVAVPLVRRHVIEELGGWERFTMTAAFAAGGWFAAIGLFRGAMLIAARPPRSVAYVAGASFWMYLVHHPFVGLAQIALHGRAWPAEVKYCVAALAAVTLSLLTYEAGVRQTWIGALLNGRPATAEQSPAPAQAEQPAPMRRAA